MMKMKRQKAKWSAVLTSAAMLMINIPVSAEEQSQYINGVTQINGYTEFEQPQVIENQDMAQLATAISVHMRLRMQENWHGLFSIFMQEI